MNPSSNHGVTTILGDLLLGTNELPKKIKVPEKLKMDWLTNPETGDVWQDFSKDYELIYLRKTAPERRRKSTQPINSNKDRLSIPCA